MPKSDKGELVRPPEVTKLTNRYARQDFKSRNVAADSSGLIAKAELRSRLVLGWNPSTFLTNSKPVSGGGLVYKGQSDTLDGQSGNPSRINDKVQFNSKDTKIVGISFRPNELASTAPAFDGNLNEMSLISVKGYGEEQFESNDNEKNPIQFPSLQSAWLNASSVIPEDISSFVIASRPMTTRTSQGRSLRSRDVPHARDISYYLEKGSAFLTNFGSLSRPDTGFNSSVMNKELIASTPAHLTMSRLYYSSQVDEPIKPAAPGSEAIQPPHPSGIELIADAMTGADGVEFCYLQQAPEHSYSFAIRDTVPSTILNNEYVTLGKHGILRAVNGGASEFISHKNFQKERENYCKLRKMKLFGMYRLWKPFRAWRCFLLSRKWNNAVSASLNCGTFISCGGDCGDIAGASSDLAPADAGRVLSPSRSGNCRLCNQIE